MDELRELGPDPLFFDQLLGTAATDIETLCAVLCVSILTQNLGATRDKAHALKGIAVSVGAVRLSMIATRLIYMAPADLHREGAALVDEIGLTATHSIRSLRGLMLSPDQ
jgi:two-component system, sensor histidine kinase RpfC